ncbi:MAG: type ISP restriction/modification enzyme, partial [Dehalococcoidia bacterium]|nr:type ISP restriction/modification enzyme [Dehalococcoidia bacterium]
EALKTDQLKRYLASLHNLVLTNYLEFRWYVHGQHRLTVWLGTVTKDGKIKREKDGVEKVAELLDGFLNHEPEPVGTARELVSHMARLAGLIRHMTVNTLKAEQATGSLHAQLLAFRENLIPELSIEQFADMYAQTIAYGLFAARCESDSGGDFTREKAEYLIPKTNPFLRQLFHHIAFDLDEQIVWVVDDLAQVLALASMDEVLKGFGKPTAKEDPVVHFYETFLKAYDPAMRQMRGVYYTPTPVVSYIVRSIDHLLKTRFGKPQGLADPDVLILDPAVGTATFLYMVIQEIYSAIVSQGQQGTWNDYVTEKLLPRLFGFELLMAPYAIAHFKLGRLLKELGYQFRTDKRLGIYLTNTLEEAIKKSEMLTGFNKYIVDEANAAADIKKEQPVVVVLGNPPYSVSSANKGTYIDKLMETYKTAVRSERNIQPLSDDYIKFIRFAHERIEHTGHGIIGMITNSSYLSGLIHRGMREELLKSFSEIFVLDLRGSLMRGDTTPDGSKDENVFDIRQGVAIILLVRYLDHKEAKHVHYADLQGLRESKYKILAESDVKTTSWTVFEPNSPFYFFLPRSSEFKQEFGAYLGLTDIFPVYSSGIKTHRDHLVVDYDNSILKQRITIFRESELSDEEVKERLGLEDTNSWSIANARKTVRDDKDWETAFTNYLYRPFDIRSIFYHKSVIERPRPEVMQHMLFANIALCTTRQLSANEFRHILVANRPIDYDPLSLATRERTFIFPLYLYPTEGEMQFDGRHRRANLNPEFIKAVSEKLGLTFIEDGKGDFTTTFGPEDIFNYAYAVFHSPTYRSRYAEFLKIDFPRLPLTFNKELFKKLAEKGAELVALHLLESPVVTNFVTTYPVGGDHSVEKVSYDEKKQRVNINKTQYFKGVPPEVWNFHIGGYQVCQKWLKDRKGRTLSYDELIHYQKVIVALKETIRLMEEIDELIPGWPVE